MTGPGLIRPSAALTKRQSCGIDQERLRIFVLSATSELGADIAAVIGLPASALEERGFEDGEHKTRPLDSVRDADVFVVQSLHAGPSQSANDKLCSLLFFIGALKDAGAARVTAVVPYLCYARKDRRTKPNDPVTTRYVAAMFEAVGTDRIVTLDVHNPAAFENAFRCQTVALTATPLFIEYAKSLPDRKLCVISPDAGGMKRAELFREALEAELACPVGKALAEKYRSGGAISGDLFAGDVRGATTLVIDDLISTGTTLQRTAHAARRAGAAKVVALATHGLFMRGAIDLLRDPAIDQVVVTDSVPAFRLDAGSVGGQISILRVAPLLAEVILRLHRGQTLTDLLVF